MEHKYIKSFLFILMSFGAMSFADGTHKGDRPAAPEAGYFDSPMNRSLKLSGTFGELRNNHFHAGIDIKSSAGGVGDPVYAPADGFISRVNIEGSGYGNSLMIDHPNGYSTLYAHLLKFAPSIQLWAKNKQYESQSFEIDVAVPRDVFPVSKGQIIAYMGNTGASQAPHLHFEIRETSTQIPVNPLKFYLPVQDNQAPAINYLSVYSLNNLKQSFKTQKFITYKRKNGEYKLAKDTILIGSWRTGFGLNTFDFMEGSWSKNGVYSIEMYVDDVLTYGFKMDSIALDKTRNINAHMDYLEKVNRNSFIHRCYTLPGNQLSIYNENINNGLVDLYTDRARKIRLKSLDQQGNTAVLEFYVKRDPNTLSPEPTNYNYILPYNEPSIIRVEGMELYMPTGTIFEDLYLKFKSQDDPSNGIYSKMYHIHDKMTPVNSYYNIAIKPSKAIPDNLRTKSFVAMCDRNVVTNCGGTWNGDSLITEIRSFGDFCIMIDTIAPTITPVVFRSDLSRAKFVRFSIGDNIRNTGRCKGLTYKAYIDNQWICMAYDARYRTITYDFEPDQYKGRHTLKLEVADAVGNKKVFEREFWR